MPSAHPVPETRAGLPRRARQTAARVKMPRVTRSLVNSLSTAEIMLVFVLGSVVVAVGLAIGIRTLIPDIAERQFEDMMDGLRVVYELLFALLLAFVVASVLDRFNQAEGTVQQEASALSAMLRDNLAFPADTQTLLRRSMGAYVNATIGPEWQTMRAGAASPEAAGAIESLYAVYRSYTPANATQTQFYQEALAHLDEVAAARRQRLTLSSEQLPSVLLLMLPIGVLLLLVVEYRPRLGPRSQTAFMGTLALIVSSSYVLTIVLDYPFSGDVAVTNEPLHSGPLASLTQTFPRAPQPGDRPVPVTARALVGVWTSEAYGTVLLARRGNELVGDYRALQGTITGTVTPSGIFRGVWCEAPTRAPGATTQTSHAGLVEWRLVDTRSDGPVLAGVWSSGYAHRPDGSFAPAGSWDMRKLKVDQALDLAQRLTTDPPSWYCHAP